MKTLLGRDVAFVLDDAVEALLQHMDVFIQRRPSNSRLALRWGGSVPPQTLAPQNDVDLKLQGRVLQRRWRRWSICSVKRSEAVSESLWHEMSRFQSEQRRPRDSRVFIVKVPKKYRETWSSSNLSPLAASAEGSSQGKITLKKSVCDECESENRGF